MSMRLLSIDPGTNHLGYTFFEVAGVGDIRVLDIGTLEVAKYAQRFTGIIDVHGEKIAKLYGIEVFIAEYLNRWCPTVVVSESPYMGRFPAAFAALVECLSSIRNALIEYDRSIPLDTTDPASVKQALGVSGKSGNKELITLALSGVIDFFSMHKRFDIYALDEHARDSLAVGLALLQERGYITLKKG